MSPRRRSSKAIAYALEGASKRIPVVMNLRAGRRAEKAVARQWKSYVGRVQSDIAEAVGRPDKPTMTEVHEGTMSVEMSVPGASEGGDYQILDEGTRVTAELTRWEGPFEPKTPLNEKGKPNNKWVKLFFRCIGGEEEGFEFSSTTDTYIGQTNRTRKLFEAMLGSLEEGTVLTFDALVGKRCLIDVGIRTTDQGGLFNKAVAYWPIKKGGFRTAPKVATTPMVVGTGPDEFYDVPF